VILAIALPVTAALLFWLGVSPSGDRNWAVDHSRMPRTTFDGSRFTVEEVRNFQWKDSSAFEARWETRSYDLDHVSSAWYVLVPFSREWRGPAHALVSFGFDDGRYLAISVEARREAGETYGILKGFLRRFELIYVIGDEVDLIGRRAVYDGTDVFVYPIAATPEGLKAVLRGMLERANALREHPEFYHTVTNNCTLNLVKHVNQFAPGRIPASWRLALPGYSDQVAHAIGLIDTTLPIEAARRKYLVNDRARAAMGTPGFSASLRP
jgi:hypothetical protein